MTEQPGPPRLESVGPFATWMLILAYGILTLPTQWVKAVLPYYGDVIFGSVMTLVALPYLFMRSFWRGTSKWAICLMVYGMTITILTREGANPWAFGWREFILDVLLLLSITFGIKLAEASFTSLRSLVARISWVCILMGVGNIILMRFGYVQIDADATNRVVSISLFYIIGPLLFLVPLQVTFRLGALLPVLSVALVGLVAYFTLTRSIAVAFFLLLAQSMLLLLRRATGTFAAGFTVWVFVVLPIMAVGSYYMVDSIADARGMVDIANTSGRDLEFEEFMDQMSPRGWFMGNGLGTGFLMNGYDPETGAAAKVMATGLHYTTLTPVLKFGAVFTISLWLSLLYFCTRIFLAPGDVNLKAVIFVPINYAVIYSISGGWLSSTYLIVGIALGVLLNFRTFAESATETAQPPQPDGRTLLHRRHRHL